MRKAKIYIKQGNKVFLACREYGEAIYFEERISGFTDKVVKVFDKLEDAIKFKNKVNFQL